ncbi:unnamed protein product, partial [Allacma fusca]
TLYTKELQKSSSLKHVYYFIPSFFPKIVPGASLTKTNSDIRKFHYFNKHCARIVEDGTLYYVENFNWVQVPRTNYCLDEIQSLGKGNQQYGFVLRDSSKVSNSILAN